MSEGCTRSGHEPDDVCECAAQPTLYGQSLSEMDFERGIWSAAIDGELDRVRKYLDKGGDPDIIDSSGYTALVCQLKISSSHRLFLCCAQGTHMIFQCQDVGSL